MPRPAKPPMTLKEAKRAYKKDDTGFRYTPSQMARADRQDAQEEKRRKALEKERTKLDNKRKREEKAERDRAVKRKMLDEGRITVEDTWGKVAASQPRLNKFFARPPTKLSPSSRLSHKITSNTEDEHEAEDDLLLDLVSEVEDNVDGRETEETKDETDAQQDNGAPDTLSTTKVPAQPSQTTTSIGVRNPPSTSRSRIRQPSPLQEQRSSQINARAGRPTNRSSYLRTGSKTLINDEKNPAAVNKPTELQSCVPTPLPNARANKLDSSAPNKRSDQTRVLRSADSLPLVPLANPGFEGSKPAGSCSGIDRTNRDLEEDFTDGIGDHEFLLLCDAQNGPGHKSASSISPLNGPKSDSLPVLTSNDDTTSTIELPHFQLPIKEDQNHTPFSGDDNTTSTIPPVLNESFSAVFNEIDDSELIAFADEVEASMVASGQACPIPKDETTKRASAASKKPSLQIAPKPTSWSQNKNSHSHHEDMKERPLNRPLPQNADRTRSRSKVTPANSHNPSSSRITASTSSFTVPAKTSPPPKSSQVKPKRRRVLPWDEIEGPGPSTQAVMLELLEKAEAQMNR